jgi:hypothetical protein
MSSISMMKKTQKIRISKIHDKKIMVAAKRVRAAPLRKRKR